MSPNKMTHTNHSIYISSAQDMGRLKSESIDLVVTSPPYPMIEMWDDIMSAQNPSIKEALTSKPELAFELMHQELDKVWSECYRLLKDGGLMCINIGDATRSINKEFQLFNNHTRVVNACLSIGFINLPNIIWRKQTNAPNKFMGSGMLPCGAYVTLEHEWILVFRKGGKRNYLLDEAKKIRRESSFFWAERNKWFSDIWEVKGAKQRISNSLTRERNASFPLEIPFRLINMYSQQGDTVLDPFLGMGTTTIAAMLSQRNSIGIEIDDKLLPSIEDNIDSVSASALNDAIYQRYCAHLDFVKDRESAGKEVKYYNEFLKCKVMTAQETDMNLHYVNSIEKIDSAAYQCGYYDQVAVADHSSTKIDSLFFSARESIERRAKVRTPSESVIFK